MGVSQHFCHCGIQECLGFLGLLISEERLTRIFRNKQASVDILWGWENLVMMVMLIVVNMFSRSFFQGTWKYESQRYEKS